MAGFGTTVSNFLVNRAVAKQSNAPTAPQKPAVYTQGQQILAFDRDSDAKFSAYNKDTGKYFQSTGSIFHDVV